jgi:thioredoxin reductase (NADPH)
MSHITGVEFLEKAMEIYPEAKRVLLTAYADTDAAIRSINKARIDYYLMKPGDPPEENLYPHKMQSFRNHIAYAECAKLVDAP